MADYDFAGALGGFSAGVAQQLPQWQSVRNQTRQTDMMEQQQKEQQVIERQKTMFLDADAALKMLDQGSIDGVLKIGQDRLQRLEDMGVDPRDTLRILMLAQDAKQGDRQAAQLLKGELQSTVQLGRSHGILQAPAGPQIVPNSAMGPNGQITMQDPSGAFRTVTPQGYQAEQKPENFNQPFLSDGTPNQAYQDYQIRQRAAGKTDINIGQATDAERTAGILANRLDFAQSQINDVLAANPGSQSPQALPTVLSNMGMDYLSRVTNPTERQIIEAAQDDMLDAALTLGTGAAYTKEQLQGYRKSYFPQIGDDKVTIENKAKRLQNLIDGAYTKAGRGAPEQRRSAQPAQQPQGGPPAPGTVMDGYRFKGGDPADQNNWEPQ